MTRHINTDPQHCGPGVEEEGTIIITPVCHHSLLWLRPLQSCLTLTVSPSHPPLQHVTDIQETLFSPSRVQQSLSLPTQTSSLFKQTSQPGLFNWTCQTGTRENNSCWTDQDSSDHSSWSLHWSFHQPEDGDILRRK